MGVLGDLSLSHNFAQRKFGTRLSRRFAPLRRSHVEPLRGILHANNGFRVGFTDTNTPVPSCLTGNQYAVATSERLFATGQQKTVSIAYGTSAYRSLSGFRKHG